jgi:diguanylate cyclase (GGDEF)-like protein
MNLYEKRLKNLFYEAVQLSSIELNYLFEQNNIPLDICWRTIYKMIFDIRINYGAKNGAHFKNIQLEPVMKQALEIAQKNDFSEKNLEALIKNYNLTFFAECYNELANALKEINTMSKDFKSILEQRQGNMISMEQDTIKTIESDQPIEIKVEQIKSNFKTMIKQFHTDVENLDQINNTDHLTGLFNRRSFDNQLAVEVSAAMQEKLWISLLMIDIDNFKMFNDTYGHQTGDKAIVTVTKYIKRICDKISANADVSLIPCRYGGEEFTVILPTIEPKIAGNIAEGIREKINAHNLIVTNQKDHTETVNINISVSIGVASLIHGLRIKDAMDDLIERADIAMYDAKQSGKNCVKFAINSAFTNPMIPNKTVDSYQTEQRA